MALIKDYFDKTNKYIQEYGENSIVLMQVGAFFEVYGLKKSNDNSIYGSQIMEFSRICDLNVVDKKVCVGSEHVKMAGFKDMFLDKYVNKLQNAGFTSIVFTQDEICEGEDIKRSLAGIFSPGTYFSCESNNITNNSCCIWLHLSKNSILGKNKPLIYVGTAIIDIYTGKTFIFEFKEIYINNPTTFDELERIISSYNPSETVIIYNLSKKEVDDVINYTNIQSQSIHFVSLLDDEKSTNNNENTNKNKQRAKNCEKQIYQKELLEKFYLINDYSSFIESFCENIIAIQSLCFLLDFIFQHNPNLIHKIKEPVLDNIGDKLILANHSLKQLNIIDDQFKGKYSSVLKMLNDCVTTMGKRKFTYHFLNPTTDEIYLQKEYNIIEYCLTKMDVYLKIKPLLLEIADLTKFHRQIIMKKITPKNLYQLFYSLHCIKNIYKIIIIDANLNEYLKSKLPEYINLLDTIEELSAFLERNLIMELCKDIDSIQKLETNFIKFGINILLDEKTQLLQDSENKLESCRKYFNDLISLYENNSKSNKKNKEDKTEYVKIYETEKNNFSLIATERRCKVLEELLKNANSNANTNANKNVCTIELKYSKDANEKKFDFDIKKGVIEFVKHSSSNKYITSYQIQEICKNVSNLKNGLMNTISQVYLQILDQLIGFQKQFDIIAEFITLLDVIFTKAVISKKYGYCKPVIDSDVDKSFINVKSLRHCLIEHIQQNELYVANDIMLGYKGLNLLPIKNGDHKGLNPLKKDGILLYGTNAVGKTSFIRSLGIAVIMAQAGLYVPASEFRYKPYKYIFTRILGNDNIFKGLSTFAVEMSELNTILRLANKNSLILGDELCSGTESISATSIFVAGIKQLANIEASFIFATHLHEIINYDEIQLLKNVQLNHMSVYYDKAKDMLVYDRKIKDGPGNNMYGLEVCKSLNLPQEFLELANNIRMKYHPESASILDQKKSVYNADFIKSICEKCNTKMGEEVHHMQYQKDANDNNLISIENTVFHKNHPANLLNICKKCHDEIHKKNMKQKKVKTSKGIKVLDI
jgi:DNA mismatch repair protein MutS